MPTYSHSRLSAFEQCPQKYKFQYLDRLPPAHETIEAFLGSRVHDTLEKLYADLQFTKLNTLEELLAFYDRQWEMEFSANIKIVRAERSPDDYRAAGRQMLERYYRRFHPFKQGTTLGLELHLYFPLGDGVQFQGYIDRVTGTAEHTYEIHDYKTGNSTPSQAEAERDRQLALYELGLRQRWPDAGGVKLIWHYLVSGTDLEVVKTPPQLEAARQEALKVVRVVEAARDFPPRETRLCDWCGYFQVCPAKQHLAAVTALPAEAARAETGVSLVDRYAAAKEKAKGLTKEIEELEAALVEYAEAKRLAVVVGTEKKVTISERQVTTLPAKGSDPAAYTAVVELLRRSGTWELVSALDRHAAVAALSAGSLPEPLARQLAPYLKTETRKSLSISKRED